MDDKPSSHPPNQLLPDPSLQQAPSPLISGASIGSSVPNSRPLTASGVFGAVRLFTFPLAKLPVPQVARAPPELVDSPYLSKKSVIKDESRGEEDSIASSSSEVSILESEISEADFKYKSSFGGPEFGDISSFGSQSINMNGNNSGMYQLFGAPQQQQQQMMGSSSGGYYMQPQQQQMGGMMPSGMFVAPQGSASSSATAARLLSNPLSAFTFTQGLAAQSLDHMMGNPVGSSSGPFIGIPSGSGMLMNMAMAAPVSSSTPSTPIPMGQSGGNYLSVMSRSNSSLRSSPQFGSLSPSHPFSGSPSPQLAGSDPHSHSSHQSSSGMPPSPPLSASAPQFAVPQQQPPFQQFQQQFQPQMQPMQQFIQVPQQQMQPMMMAPQQQMFTMQQQPQFIPQQQQFYVQQQPVMQQPMMMQVPVQMQSFQQQQQMQMQQQMMMQQQQQQQQGRLPHLNELHLEEPLSPFSQTPVVRRPSIFSSDTHEEEKKPIGRIKEEHRDGMPGASPDSLDASRSLLSLKSESSGESSAVPSPAASSTSRLRARSRPEESSSASPSLQPSSSSSSRSVRRRASPDAASSPSAAGAAAAAAASAISPSSSSSSAAAASASLSNIFEPESSIIYQQQPVPYSPSIFSQEPTAAAAAVATAVVMGNPAVYQPEAASANPAHAMGDSSKSMLGSFTPATTLPPGAMEAGDRPSGVPEKPYKCSFAGCFKTFSHSTNLKRHLKSHSGEKPFACTHPGCDKRFQRNSDLRTHIRAHTHERPFLCRNPECGKRFTTCSNLRRHEKTHPVETLTLKDSFVPDPSTNGTSTGGLHHGDDDPYVDSDFDSESEAVTSPSAAGISSPSTISASSPSSNPSSASSAAASSASSLIASFASSSDQSNAAALAAASAVAAAAAFSQQAQQQQQGPFYAANMFLHNPMGGAVQFNGQQAFIPQQGAYFVPSQQIQPMQMPPHMQMAQIPMQAMQQQQQQQPQQQQAFDIFSGQQFQMFNPQR